jgi:anti-anti-sigma factor
MGARVEQVVVVSGRVDGSTSNEVRALLHRALDTGRRTIVVDLSGAATLDLTGLGVLFGAHWRAARQGQEVVLRGTPPRIARVLRATRLHRVLRSEAALAA